VGCGGSWAELKIQTGPNWIGERAAASVFARLHRSPPPK